MIDVHNYESVALDVWLDWPSSALALFGGADMIVMARAAKGAPELLVARGAVISEAVRLPLQIKVISKAPVWAPSRDDVTSVVADGEVYTNIDRLPDESGSMAEVLRARRMLEIERRAMIRDIRRESDAALERARAVARDSAPAVVVDDASPADEDEQ